MKPCALVVACVLLGFSPQAGTSGPARETAHRLATGEIVLLDADSSQAGGSARVQALVLAPVESVWNVITSCELSFVFVDGLKQCQVIEDFDNRALVHQVVKRGMLVPTQDFVYASLREPYREIRFSLVEGSLKEMEGKWQFSETPEGVLIDYSIRVRPVFPVPGFIVSWVMRKGMPDLIACIRGLADGSGSPDRNKNDLERCRGEKTPAR